MNKKISFEASDGITYEFPLSILDENTDYSQVLRWQYLSKYYNKAVKLADEDEQKIELFLKISENFFNFIAFDFFREFPKHELSEIYDKRKGLSEDGIIAFAQFVGSVNNYMKLLEKLTSVVIENKNEDSTGRTKRASTKGASQENQVRLIETGETEGS